MIYTRKEHYLFLEEELQAQTDAFQHKLDTSASFLLNDREELFVAQFVKFSEGEIILKFNNSRGIPRKGEYLYCFTSPKHLHNFREWGDITYGELIKNKGFSTELVCIWQYSLRDNPQYCLVGFRGADLEFAEHIEGHAGAFLVLGPNVPPYQYIGNLQKIVRDNQSDSIRNLLEGNVEETSFAPQPFANNVSVTDFVVKQLSLADSVIIQGPPGTGKTTQIANLCEFFCSQGLSVLVTALTNRALMEVAAKDDLKVMLEAGRVYKTKMSVDEAKELPRLQNLKQITPEKGKLTLSTFYITSGEANNVGPVPPFDIVIMDEASQALLAMFAAVKLLGKKTLYVGDPNQLSPVVSLNSDRIARRNYHFYVDGIVSVNALGSIPAYSLTTTYRLSGRAATFTGFFYDNILVSAQDKTKTFTYEELPKEFDSILDPQGGPSMIKMDLPLGDKKTQSVLTLSTLIVSAFLSLKEKLHITVLSSYIETTKALQKTIFQTVGNHSNLLIDTVSRIQGLTTDVAIYVIPNTGYSFSLDKRLFNVATSRAKRHTIIICDTNILSSGKSIMNYNVFRYLSKLNETQSVCILQNVKYNQLTLEVPKDNYDVSLQKEIESNNVSVQQEEVNSLSGDSTFIKTEIPNVGVKIVGFVDLTKFKSKKKVQSKKTYIIDTNVFVECPDICNKIDRNCQIILSAKVIDELDKLKITLEGSNKENVNNALSYINKALNRPNISFEVANTHLLPADFNRRSPDNMILSVALKYKDDNPTLLTSDNGLQIKCKGLGITTVSLKTFLKR